MSMRHAVLGLLLAGAAAGASAQPYIGEIRWVGFDFAPEGWAPCDGRLLPIAENDALFALIGTTYGGDGQETFAVPDLRGRIPIHMGTGPGLSNYQLGQAGGEETVTLTNAQMASHAHTAYALSDAGNRPGPLGRNLARVAREKADGSIVATNVRAYKQLGTTQPMAAGMIGPAGGGQPHDNVAPFQSLNCIISLFGVFPTQN